MTSKELHATMTAIANATDQELHPWDTGLNRDGQTAHNVILDGETIGTVYNTTGDGKYWATVKDWRLTVKANYTTKPHNERDFFDTFNQARGAILAAHACRF